MLPFRGNSVLAACVEAFRSIDMEAQEGIHPCLGAVDLIPIYPLAGVGVEECGAVARSKRKLGVACSFLIETIFIDQNSSWQSHHSSTPWEKSTLKTCINEKVLWVVAVARRVFVTHPSTFHLWHHGALTAMGCSKSTPLSFTNAGWVRREQPSFLMSSFDSDSSGRTMVCFAHLCLIFLSRDNDEVEKPLKC